MVRLRRIIFLYGGLIWFLLGIRIKKEEVVDVIGSPSWQYEDRPVKKFYWEKG